MHNTVFVGCSNGIVSINNNNTVTNVAPCSSVKYLYYDTDHHTLYAGCSIITVVVQPAVISVLISNNTNNNNNITTYATTSSCYTQDLSVDRVHNLLYVACGPHGVLHTTTVVNGLMITASSVQVANTSQCQANSAYYDAVTGGVYANCNVGAVLTFIGNWRCPPGYGFVVSQCNVCSIDYYNDGTSAVCIICPPGTFSSSAGNSVCSSCPNG